MQIIKWDPFEEADHAFDERFFSLQPALWRFGRDLAADIYEENGIIVVKMNIPGINGEDIEITLKNDLLTVLGSRREEKETDKKDYYSKEIRRGSFVRTVQLPHAANALKAEARYADGVLTIALPVVKGEKENTQKIKILELE